MGDHRASVKIEFTIHGQTYRMDSYINWFDDGTGVDGRVIKFFSDSWQDARARYDEQLAAYEEERDREDRERAERAELERLKAKYEHQTT